MSGFFYLGSTGASLAKQDGSGYFQPPRGHLNEEGQRLLQALDAHYGCEAVIYTFLDT